MILYVPTTPESAEKLSRELYHLLMPAAVRDSANVSTHYCSWIAHPTDSAKALLCIPDDDISNIHQLANATELGKEFSKFVGRGSVTPAEANAIASAITSKKGKSARFAEFIPPSWQSKIMTRQQAIAAGFLKENL